MKKKTVCIMTVLAMLSVSLFASVSVQAVGFVEFEEETNDIEIVDEGESGGRAADERDNLESAEEIPIVEEGESGGDSADAEGAEGIPLDDLGESGGDSADVSGLNLTEETFEVGDLPEEYLKTAKQRGTVERVRYKMYIGDDVDVKSVMVYLPAGYEDSDEKYNVIYLLHPSGGSPKDYLNNSEITDFQRLVDNMIANEVIDPVIIAAPTYFPSDSYVQYMPLALQVTEVSDFPDELVNYIIPAVEEEFRTYAESTDEAGIIASRDHRAVAGFSLGGTATWDVFIQKMCCARWYLPISEASWDDGDGGIKGIWDSDLSAEVLYESVLEQGYTSEDFILFVATGTDDIAFEIATEQMKSLLEYNDMFITGTNTSCSMMIGGTHTQSAIYTYMYHIMPALFQVFD